MAVATTTNADYIAIATVQNLKGISISKGYWTDVRDVRRPDFGPDDIQDMLSIAQEGAALYVWAVASREAVGHNQLGSTAKPCRLTLAVVGVVKQADEVQSAILRLSADVQRVMLQNPRRNFDGSTVANGYCIDTLPAGDPTFDFLFGRIDASTTAALFYSAWDVTYVFPLTTG